MKFRAAILIASITLTTATAFGQSGNKYVELTKILGDYDSAWNKKDTKAVADILAPDYTYFSSTGGLTDRARTLEFLGSPDYKLTFVERSEVSFVSALSPDRTVAVISSRWKGRGSFGKEGINDDQRCGLVFVKQAHRWKLLSEHCVQIVAK